MEINNKYKREPVVHVAQYLRNALGLFKKAEVTPIIYFDGCHHIHKAATDAGRRIIVELNALLVAARPSDYNDVARLRKNSVAPASINIQRRGRILYRHAGPLRQRPNAVIHALHGAAAVRRG